RESRTGKPVHSVYFRREELPKGSSPQLGLAVKLGVTAATGRWMAVLNAGSLHALYWHGNSDSVRLAAVRVQEANPALLATGFETPAQVPTFFIASGSQIHAYEGNDKELVRKWSATLPFPLPPRHFVRAAPGQDLGQVTFVLIQSEPSHTRAVAVTY